MNKAVGNLVDETCELLEWWLTCFTRGASCEAPLKTGRDRAPAASNAHKFSRGTRTEELETTIMMVVIAHKGTIEQDKTGSNHRRVAECFGHGTEPDEEKRSRGQIRGSRDGSGAEAVQELIKRITQLLDEQRPN